MARVEVPVPTSILRLGILAEPTSLITLNWFADARVIAGDAA